MTTTTGTRVTVYFGLDTDDEPDAMGYAEGGSYDELMINLQKLLLSLVEDCAKPVEV